MKGSYDKLQPVVRGPIDSGADETGDPDPARLEGDVLLLSSPIHLERIQATNRLKQSGTEGVTVTVRFVAESSAEPEQLVAAIRFLNSVDFASLESEEQSTVRDALTATLGHEDADVRVESARALQVHGPGARRRTALLAAIGDDEKRVRWAVVRRFGDHPEELEQPQRSLLLTFLDAGTRQDFHDADQDDDNALTRTEFRGLDKQFHKLDRDGDDEISLEEWINPVPGEIRADVVALLLRLHGALTPDLEPTVYNPWLPASDQLGRVKSWREWSESVSEAEAPDEDEG